MRIWIINYYTGTPENMGNPRYIQLARHFMDAGHDVVTFNSSFAAGTQKEQTRESKRFIERAYGDFKFVHANAPEYTGNGIKRMFSIWKFASMIKSAAKRFPKPDVILHNVHLPFDYPVATLAKKLKCKYITEAWDLWPENFVVFGLMSPKSPFMKIAHWIEKKVYYSADERVFTMLGAFDYLKRQGWMIEQGGRIDPKHLHYINNGIDLKQFDEDKNKYLRPDTDINDEKLIKIVYLGSIRLVNDVKQLIDAAALLKDDARYKFFLYGDGNDRPYLEQYLKDNHIDNVVFKETRIRYEECAWVVSQATINIMNYNKGFGDTGVSSGKMFQYLAAGKPIVCNVHIAYDDVITDNNLGVARDIFTPEEFAFEIKRLAELPQNEYNAMCERVREVAARFDYGVLAAEELKVIENSFYV